jgi:hypothetical protein
MVSEELQQRYPNNSGKRLGKYELFETQLTTINQFAAHGLIPNNPEHARPLTILLLSGIVLAAEKANFNVVKKRNLL